MSGLPAPQSVLELIAGKCRKSYKEPSCLCIMNGMKCSDMCSLKNCENQSDLPGANDESD